ncbi:TetR family transcriptional regulator [Cobetia crustatorum]|uniref:TetR family transcriptional regulator n=2 Tax=Halomonadaceae TaxID=28256 RepID=A0A558HLJ9_9GAMM|nr:TetR family transcriptional regulator [Cobetia crustatorum]
MPMPADPPSSLYAEVRRSRSAEFSAAPASSPREQAESRILEAAECVFACHGYRGSTLKQIADVAELPKANLLYYFGSKEKLYVHLLEQTLTRWNASLEDISPEDEPRDVLEALVRTKLKLARQAPQASRLFAAEVISGAPFLREYLSGALRDWVQVRCDVMKAWMVAGKLREAEPMWVIYLIWSTTQHYADFAAQIDYLGGAPQTDEDWERLADFVSSTLCDGLCPRQA